MTHLRVALLIWGRPSLRSWVVQLSSPGSASCDLSSSSRLAGSYSHDEGREATEKASIHGLFGLSLELAFYILTSSHSVAKAVQKGSQVQGWGNRLHHWKELQNHNGFTWGQEGTKGKLDLVLKQLN